MTHVTTTSGWIPLEPSSGDFRSFGVAVDSIELGNSIFFSMAPASACRMAALLKLYPVGYTGIAAH